MSQRAKLVQKALLVLLLGGSAFLCWNLAPPTLLTKWVGGDPFWVRALMTVVVYLASYCLLMTFLTKVQEIAFPGGFSLKSEGKDEPAPVDPTLTELVALRRVVERSEDRQQELFTYLGGLARQQREILEKIEELEGRTQSVETQVSATATSDEPAR